LLSFNIVAVANTVFTVSLFLATGRICDERNCNYDLDTGIIWMLSQLLIVPVVLVTLVAVLIAPRRRRLKSAWPGYVALVYYALLFVISPG
jgi:hypothetical protein